MALLRALALLCATAAVAYGQLVNVEFNKVVHRRSSIANAYSEPTVQVVLAYEGLPLDTTTPDAGLDNIFQKLDGEDPDFAMIELVRILYLSDRHDAGYSYDELILPALQKFSYWPQQGETVEYAYWSENHLVMWLSSHYLLRQREGWPADADGLLETRLRHWLDLKLEYGFYEWNAPVYQAFTLAAVLNLVDFAKDEDIRTDAEAVANRLLQELMRMTNDQGVYFPVAGRGAYNKYDRPFNYFLSPVVWLLTELTEQPPFTSLPSGFMATSGMRFERASATWSPSVDQVVAFGHPIAANVHSMLPRQDRTFFQFSAGGYFHPDIAEDTAFTSNYYDIDDIPQIPEIFANVSSRLLTTFSRSSVISQATFHYYKHNGVTLSSAEQFYGGYFGYQQYPWMAAVDDLAIFTVSGPVTTDWSDRDHNTANTHLPRVIQRGNVALVMYWPNTEIGLAFGTPVTLHWKDEWFDHVEQHGRWIMGVKRDSFVAVYRHRSGTSNGWYYSGANFGRQFWAVVVGTRDTHVSFGHFVSTVVTSEHADESFAGLPVFGGTYNATVSVDGTTISHSWTK